MSDFDRQLEHVIHGRIAKRTLDDLEPFLVEMEREVDRRIIGLLKGNLGLAAEIAQQAWYEKFAVHQLRERLSRLVRAGKSAGAHITPEMEPTHG